MTSGEEMEQTNSYMSRAGFVTKTMTKTGVNILFALVNDMVRNNKCSQIFLIVHKKLFTNFQT